MSFLYEIDLTDLAPERVYHTPFGTNEFTAVLRKGQQLIERDKAFIEPVSLEDSISVLKQKNSYFEAEIARLRDELTRVHSSRSWALTEPFRRLENYLGMGVT
jgi:hypothetical protein